MVSLTLVFRITTDDYTQAVLERQEGNLDSSPLGVALARYTYFRLTRYAPEGLTVIDQRNRAMWSGRVPFDLAEFIMRFEQGAPAIRDRNVELLLLRNSD